MPWKRLLPLLVTAAAVLMIVITAIVVVTHRHKPDTGDAVTSVTVAGKSPDAKFTIRTAADAPAGTIPDAQPLGNAFQIDHTVGDATGAVLHFALNRGKLPAGEPGCQQATLDVNMAIAVFNTQVQAWIPLETTCTGNELTAVAPHFSLFQAWIVNPGKHVYHWAAKGVQKTVQVVTTVTTRIVSYAADVASYMGDLVKAVTVTFFDNLLAKFDNSKYVCNPASTKYTVDVNALANAAYHNSAIAACTVNSGGAEQVHLRNGNAIPLSFGGNQYLRAVPTDPANLDLFGLLEGAFAYARSLFLVPGLEAGSFGIADAMPDNTKVTGQMDIPSVLLDLATTVLAVFLPEFKATDTVMQQLMVRVNERLIVIVNDSGIAAVKITDVETAIRTVVQQNSNWADHLDNALKVVDMVKCLSTRDYSPKGLAEAAFNCLSTVFDADGLELQNLLVSLAGSVRVVPELVQADTAAQFRTLTGVDVTRVDLTIGRVFNPADVYKPFVGDWHVHGTNLHLYTAMTGREDTSIGPCDINNASSPICWQHSTIGVSVTKQGGVVVTFRNYDVTDDIDGKGKHYPNTLAAGANAIGDQFRLDMIRPGVIQLTGLNAHSQQIMGNDLMCGQGASQADIEHCN